jgi:Uroporphyrinogen decarboxylase (URO-D)
MTSRERVQLVLEHKEPDRVPLDLGASPVTGMHVDTVYKLRQALGLDAPGTPVRVTEPYQLLGEIQPDLMEALGVDVVGLGTPATMFGFKNEGWKPWTTFEGTPVLVPEDFNTEPDSNGDILMYPEGDRSAPPSGRMPKGGFYFDTIVRQPPIDDDNLRMEDNLEEFGPVSDEDLEYYRREAKRLSTETDKAILANFGGTAFGDIALVPTPWLKHPKGIRDIEEWYISTVTRRDHVYKIFECQCEIAVENLEKLFGAVGNCITAAYISGTDFGQQNGPFISPKTYRDLYKPFYKILNDWVHKNTQWKCFIHSCGSVRALLPDFVDSGFDIINPVQCSAAGMDPDELKQEFGSRVTFWGGGVDTQRTLPFGTPEEVRQEVCARLKTFGRGGGFVFNTTHNVQARVPVENVQAMYETVRKCGQYPL